MTPMEAFGIRARQEGAKRLGDLAQHWNVENVVKTWEEAPVLIALDIAISGDGVKPGVERSYWRRFDRPSSLERPPTVMDHLYVKGR